MEDTPQSPLTSRFRTSNAADAASLVALINDAYAPAEAFLYYGVRIEEPEVRRLLERGSFLLECTPDGVLRGCVYVEVAEEPAYLGLLAIRPASQRQGLARALLAEAEAFARSRGRHTLELSVVNHRTELLAFYGRAGYRTVDERPLVREGLKLPAHLVLMQKPLITVRDE